MITLGITEHICGTNNVKNLANLGLLTGHIGFPSAGINPLRGQNNVQGACDMAALPTDFPGYQKVTDPEKLAFFEKLWGRKSPASRATRSPRCSTPPMRGPSRRCSSWARTPS